MEGRMDREGERRTVDGGWMETRGGEGREEGEDGRGGVEGRMKGEEGEGGTEDCVDRAERGERDGCVCVCVWMYRR